jgi:membrane protease YdiL (CAAX protease family)
MMNDYLKFKKIWILTPFFQVILMVLFFISIAILGKFCIMKTGLLFGKPNSFYLETLVAPIYEEIIFRGILLGLFLKQFSLFKSIVLTSILFGIWHLKNIFFVDIEELTRQIIYTGLIFSPVMCFLTYKTKTIWIASIIHYLNNFLVFLFVYLK